MTLAGETGPFERGVAAYQAHRWDEAETAFREAASADEPNPQVSVYLGRIGEARQHQELITAARTALAAGEDNVALSRVTSVPETSPLASEAQAVASEAGGRIVRAEVAAGRHALQEQRDTQEARNHLENARNHLQQARSPEANRLVQALEAELSGQAGAGAAAVVVPPTAPTAHEPDPEPEEDPEPEPDRHEDREPAGRRSTGRTATTVARRGRSSGRDASGGTSSAERTAITAYLAGRFDQAATAARSAASSASGTERRRLEGMASAIGQFAPLWNRVRSVRTPNPSQRRDMERAIALDERIARNPQYRNQLRDRVVEAYLTEARRQRSSPTASCTAVRSALRLQGSNADARRMAADCEVQARGMLRAAQTAPATRQVALCRQILSMVPASSPVARDANQLMSRARRQTSFDEDE